MLKGNLRHKLPFEWPPVHPTQQVQAVLRHLSETRRPVEILAGSQKTAGARIVYLLRRSS